MLMNLIVFKSVFFMELKYQRDGISHSIIAIE